MKRRMLASLAASLVAAGVVVAASAMPAHATVRTTPQMSCDIITTGMGYYHHRLTATANYEDDTVAGRRYWKSFRYKLTLVAGGTALTDKKNNVNIKVSKEGVVAYTFNSPDNREYSKWYNLVLVNPVWTSLRGPNGERDHREIHLVELTGIFDRAQYADPSCTGWVKV